MEKIYVFSIFPFARLPVFPLELVLKEPSTLDEPQTQRRLCADLHLKTLL